eukprot:SAG31_NODE_10510_length_1130_cov_1.005820_2_plen_137_part_00
MASNLLDRLTKTLLLRCFHSQVGHLEAGEVVRVFESVSSSASRGVALRVELGWISVLAANGRLAVEQMEEKLQNRLSAYDTTAGNSSDDARILPRQVQLDSSASGVPFLQSPVGLLNGHPRPILFSEIDPEDINTW